MSLTLQSSFPVLSTVRFSVGPNERLNVQDFLRDLARSSRAAKAASKLQDQAPVTPESESIALPQLSRNAKTSKPLQHSRASVANENHYSLFQRSVTGECNTGNENVLRLDSPPRAKVSHTNPPRIIHTYSRKKKLPPGLPTSDVVPQPSPLNATSGDRRRDARSRSRSQILAVDPAAPGINDDGRTIRTSLGAAKAPDGKSAKRKAKRAARGGVVDGLEERTKNRKYPRRAPVEGLVLLRGIIEGPCSSELEVSCDSASLVFLRKVLYRSSCPHYEVYRVTLSRYRTRRKDSISTTILLRVRVLLFLHHLYQDLSHQRSV